MSAGPHDETWIFPKIETAALPADVAEGELNEIKLARLADAIERQAESAGERGLLYLDHRLTKRHAELLNREFERRGVNATAIALDEPHSIDLRYDL